MSAHILRTRATQFLCLALWCTALLSCGSDKTVAPDACLPGSLACACLDAGCEGELTCDVQSHLCRETKSCSALGCSKGQLCGLPEGGLEQGCLPACEEGFEWAERQARCIAVQPTCDDTTPGAIRKQCSKEHRLCLQSSDGAVCAGCEKGYLDSAGSCRPVVTCSSLMCTELQRTCSKAGDHSDAECGACMASAREEAGLCAPVVCDAVPSAGTVRSLCGDESRICLPQKSGVSCGDCFPGLVEEAGKCRAARTCVDLGCESQDRLCTAATSSDDARCGACRAGFSDVGGECVAKSSATCAAGPASIGAACLAEHRTCDGSLDPDRCGACADGFVWDELAGACVAQLLCATLDCASKHRECAEFPNGHCTRCATGFTENPEDGSCRAVAGCSALSCQKGTVCVEGSSADGDASCVPDCGSDAVWNGLRCESCPPCDGEGESGRWPTPTRAGYCICKTKPGYFYSTGGDVGSVKCDADADGWVRESARLPFLSDDRALSENARCAVRSIDHFALQNERGQSHSVPLDKPLALFESDRNDDDALFAAAWAARGLPATLGAGVGARLPRAAELNRLTKFCHHVRTDYNDNGSFDVSEWGEQPAAPAISVEQLPFNSFSYFVELHEGYYVAPKATEPFGHYRIVERARPAVGTPATDGKLPLTYTAAEGDTWRTCERERDSDYGDQDLMPVGLDLAGAYTPPANPYVIAADDWRGMMHHSQFKCLALSNDPDPLVPTARKPANLSDVVLNQCTLSGAGAALGTGVNPVDAPLACSVVASTDPSVDAGAVFWGAVRYRDHGTWGAPLAQQTYERGCRNGCYSELSSCPGFSTNADAVVCTYDALDSGRFISCDVAEICDGIDNYGDNTKPDGSEDARIGTSCVPEGQLGQCLLGGGLYACQAASPFLVCQPNVVALADETACDGQDEDCNGQVDDGDPGNDGAVCVPSTTELDRADVPAEIRFGECMKGVRGACKDGRNDCAVSYSPAAEICGNGLDDDCDGLVDESELLFANGTATLAKFGVTSQPSCTDYFRDQDGDQYGVAVEKLCLCKPAGASNPHVVNAPLAALAGNYVYRGDAKKDCCDTGTNSASFHPDVAATTWITSIGPCGNFDLDCSGTEEKRYTVSGNKACDDFGVCESGDTCCQTRACRTPTVGWDGAAPACGATATWISGGCGCSSSGISCGSANTSSLQQSCH